jgi:hypothetical protein
MEIETVREKARGCGFRHSGPDGVGIYFIGEGIFESCERLPFPLACCPTCSQGIKFSRGFTWIEPSIIMAPANWPLCTQAAPGHSCLTCDVCNPVEGRQGLLWVGEKFYSTADFMKEARERGISKRISSIPHGFEVGLTVVYLAHKKAIHTLAAENLEAKPGFVPGIFTSFRPKRVELVVDTDKEDELPEKAKNLAKSLGDRVRIVRVIPENSNPELPMESTNDTEETEG